MISNVRQECEVIQTMREQIKYKNDWIKLYLDKQILDVNKKNVHKHSDKIDLTSYKEKVGALTTSVVATVIQSKL